MIDANSRIGVVRALVRMQALNDAYLLVVRTVDPKVLAYYQNTVNAVSEYKRLDKDRSRMQAGLRRALWRGGAGDAAWRHLVGLWAANRLVRPISNLIGAAEQVSEGDLKAHVELERDDDEIGSLGRAFNRMT